MHSALDYTLPLTYARRFFVLAALASAALGSGNVPTYKDGKGNEIFVCDCTATFGRCVGDEDTVHGCMGRGISCSDACPGDYPWKALYRKSRESERELVARCGPGADPTKNWTPGTQGLPFAVAFSGGMRNFIATAHSWLTNVVDINDGKVVCTQHQAHVCCIG